MPLSLHKIQSFLITNESRIAPAAMGNIVVAWDFLPSYLDPSFWNQTLLGHIMEKGISVRFMLLGISCGTYLPLFRPPFSGFHWRLFPIVKWVSKFQRCYHRTYFLYGLSLTKTWYKKKSKYVRKVWQVTPERIYVPEVWGLYRENLDNIMTDLWNMTSNANFPKEISERFFSFSALADDQLNRHQPKSCQEEGRIDLNESIDIADYTLHQLETLFPEIYRSMTEEHKQYHRAERKRRKELAEKQKKREKRKTEKPPTPKKERKTQKPREKKRYTIHLDDGSELDITDLPDAVRIPYIDVDEE